MTASHPGAPALLAARLHLPTGVVEVAVAAGEVVEVDAGVAAALAGRRRSAGRRHGPRDRVTLAGRRIDRRSTAGRVRAGLALVTTPAVAPDVSLRDHLAAVTSARHAEALLADSPLLAGRGSEMAGVLSGGERRVLAVLRAAATAPRAVLLDGAGEGLDAAALAWVGARVAGWAAAGAAVLVHPGRPEERAWLPPADR